MKPFASATELLGGLRGGRITSADLTGLYIRRIERYDAALNSGGRARLRPRAGGRPRRGRGFVKPAGYDAS